MEIVKRPATDGDWPYLMWLRRATMDRHLLASGVAPSDDYHDERLRYRYDCAEVLLCGGRRVGMLKVARSSGYWEIIQIQLNPSLQGQGIGRMLLEELIAQARTAGVDLELKVLAANPARKLYEQLGFAALGTEGSEVRMRLRN